MTKTTQLCLKYKTKIANYNQNIVYHSPNVKSYVTVKYVKTVILSDQLNWNVNIFLFYMACKLRP